MGQRLLLIPGRASKADDGTPRKKGGDSSYGSNVRDRPDSRSFACKHGSASSQGEADREGACKCMNHARKYLAQANRHIAELTVQIVRQRVIVKHALDTGQRSELAESLLDALEGSLRTFEKHRTFLLSCSGSSSAPTRSAHAPRAATPPRSVRQCRFGQKAEIGQGLRFFSCR
jgi:hypothetical protein